MRTIALVVLLTFLASPACAQPELFFNMSSAYKLNGDLKYYKQKATDEEKKYSLCDKDRKLAEGEIKQLNLKSSTLQEDLKIVTQAKDDYKDLYVKADQARLKAEEDKPSRMTWFGAGFLSAVVTGLIVMLLGK